MNFNFCEFYQCVNSGKSLPKLNKAQMHFYAVCEHKKTQYSYYAWLQKICNATETGMP